MPSIAQKGQTVLIKNIRSGKGEIYAGVITGLEGDRYYVLKFNDNKANRQGAPAETLGQAMRFDDGKPCQDGETYVIMEITSAPTDLAAAMQSAVAVVDGLKADVAALRRALTAQAEAAERRLAAVVHTIVNFIDDDPDWAEALLKAMAAAVPIRPAIKAAPETPPAPPTPPSLLTKDDATGTWEPAGAPDPEEAVAVGAGGSKRRK